MSYRKPGTRTECKTCKYQHVKSMNGVKTRHCNSTKREIQCKLWKAHNS